jgi:RecA-family ATPase
MAVATQAQVIILDNVAHLFTGNENDRGDVTRFVNLLNRLAGDTGAAVLLIGHPNKAGADYSGSTAWLNAVRSQVFLHHDRQTDVRTLSIGKANYARTGDAVRFLWDAGAFVREDDLPPDRAKELESTIRASADNELFLVCLRERNKQQRAVSEKKGTNYAPSQFARMPESKGIGKDRLETAMDRLFRISAIERGELPWQSRERHATTGLRETAANGAANSCGERGKP